MAKLPYMQFYTADYQRDTRCLSMASRGAWMDILCVLWHAPRRGRKSLSLEGWSRELGAHPSEVSQYVSELKSHEIGEFFNEIDGKITIISRRMVREERNRKSAVKRQRKHRDSQMSRSCNGSVTPPSQGYIRNQSQISESESEKKKKETTLSGSDKPDAITPSRNYRADAREVLEFLNLKVGRHYRPVESTIAMIMARLKGQNLETEVDVQACKSLIARKVREWGADEKMSKYLRPETLFNRTKFESYLGELSLCAVQSVTETSSATELSAHADGRHLRSL